MNTILSNSVIRHSSNHACDSLFTYEWIRWSYSAHVR